jgi:2-polyprenyl-3-methyl-5-hydroxy-6-metoxy-1,4-benzoquinol methylase
MPDFSKRSEEDEIMDDLQTPERELFINLSELEVVNQYLGGYKVILAALGKLSLDGETVTILDVGCGGGDTLRAISRWLKQKGKQGSLTGVDWNPVMTRYAEEHARAYPDIKFQTRDIFDKRDMREDAAQVVMCSLFCHHFKQEPLVKLLQRMHELCTEAVVINDLHRHPVAYYSIKWLTAIFSKTYVVKHDSYVSVARAFVRKDLEQIMSAAGFVHYELRWMWAFRWQIIIPKNQA